MKIYQQLMMILGFSLAGELLSSFLPSFLPIPGSILGLLLFFAALKAKIIKKEQIEQVAPFFSLTILYQCI